MSESEHMLSTEHMQKLADADAVLADLALGLMMGFDQGFGDPLWDRITTVGLGLYELQQELVDAGLAAERLDRSDREAVLGE